MFFDAHCVGRGSAAPTVTAAVAAAAVAAAATGFSQWMRETTNLGFLSFELYFFFT